MTKSDYQPIIIIGAPRSGTNMLRDIVTELPGAGSWPCDEINYIWRHGNLRFPSDEFTPDMAQPGIRKFIQQQFNSIAAKYRLDTVIEKTCANSMRLGFVDNAIPNARYIVMVRDGLDVVGSAMLRWTSSLDLSYVLRKARYVPVSDLPYYASRYLYSRAYRLLSRQKQLAFWGPQMNDMKSVLSQYSLSQVCALQWKACIENTQRDLMNIDSDRVIHVRYESFVRNPIEDLQKIATFMGKPLSLKDAARLTSKVSEKSISKGKASLNSNDIKAVLPLISAHLAKPYYDL